MSQTFPAFLVRRTEDGRIDAQVETLTVDDLPDGDVLIRVDYSSLNYKDALAAQGHPGVVTALPHVPGIDCAGTVVESSVKTFAAGDEVLVTGYGLGADHWGGYAGYARVPADWVVPRPRELTLEQCMIYGTAGFTAAQCVEAITRMNIDPDRGPVLVTGATGGVGTFAVALLAKLGYRVVAATGKPEQHPFLSGLGASEILARAELQDTTRRPLLPARWSAAVDTVGGTTLATLLRSTMHRAVVAACGLVGGHELGLTVYPFILRGVNLAGIDSQKCPMPSRLEMWRRLAGAWRVEGLESLAETVDLEHLPERVDDILAGSIVGRVLVRPRRGD